VETEAEDTVEAFLGSRVHETLEKLYRDLTYQKMNSLEDLLCFFRDEWKKNWSDDIVIVKQEYTQENYLKMGEKYIADYYKRYHPFAQGKTIALEERILIALDDVGEYKLQGYIDRLAEVKDGWYEIHDYKTNSRSPLTEYIRSDRQLALYMIGVKKQYPDVKQVRLIWHFLKFDKEIDSSRTDDELEQDESFEARSSLLCEWCEFKSVCRQWSHLYKIKEKPETEYMKDSGVRLVNQFVELKSKQKLMNLELDAKLVKLEKALIRFTEDEQVDVVFGSKNKVRVTETEKYSFPSKNSKERERLEDVLRKYGKLGEVSQLDTTALGKILSEKQWAPQVLEALQKHVELEKKKRLYVSTLKE
jgi:putative RecB family exonuclease